MQRNILEIREANCRSVLNSISTKTSSLYFWYNVSVEHSNQKSCIKINLWICLHLKKYPHFPFILILRNHLSSYLILEVLKFITLEVKLQEISPKLVCIKPHIPLNCNGGFHYYANSGRFLATKSFPRRPTSVRSFYWNQMGIIQWGNNSSWLFASWYDISLM